jgi:hypothetical protein
MALRRAQDTPPSDSSRPLDASGAARPKRALAAFLLGAALSAAGLTALIASGAAARGPFSISDLVGSGAGAGAYQPTYSVVRLEPARVHARDEGDSDDGGWRRARRRHERITLISGHSHVSGRVTYGLHDPVCVRLCDGFYFPLSATSYDATSQDAACNSLCPDAPTEVYYMNGSERIEDSVSAKGQSYTALPVSLRYRTTSDNTCSCHRDAIAASPLRDLTLRHGDAVMTPAGFMVFNGVEGVPHGAGDFAALAKASVPAAERGALQALERVSLETRHPTLKDWLVAQTLPAPAASARPLEKHAANDSNKIRLLVWRGGAVE